MKTIILAAVAAILILAEGFHPARSVSHAAEGKAPMRVVFVNPGISNPNDPTGGFWTSVSSFMKAAAEELNVDLEILYSERDHLRMQQQVREIARRKVRPDYLIVVNEKQAADEMVRIADAAGIKVFVMLNAFVGEQAKSMGVPRGKYKNWIGSLVPDNAYAGRLIAKTLIERAGKAGSAQKGRLPILAISGDAVTPAALQRLAGLEQAVSEHKGAELLQTFNGEWRRDIARQQTRIALQRYPETVVVWGANDPIALGAIEGAKDEKRRPGKDIFIGGLNWDPPALAKIKEGELEVSVGGHFMVGGWALVLLHDFHHGKDFANEGPQLQHHIFGVLDRNNVDAFLSRFGDRDWRKVDFRRFSKVLNPRLRKYDFGAARILDR